MTCILCSRLSRPSLLFVSRVGAVFLLLLPFGGSFRRSCLVSKSHSNPRSWIVKYSSRGPLPQRTRLCSRSRKNGCTRFGRMNVSETTSAAAFNEPDPDLGSARQTGVNARVGIARPGVAAAAAVAGAEGPRGLTSKEFAAAVGTQQQRGVLMEDGCGSEAERGGGDNSSSVGSGDSDPRALYTIMGLCFLVAIVCALDRVAMSVAIVPMGNLYDYSDTTKGLISSVFSWGYMASMVPSSVLIGVWGPKATITAGVVVWSAAQMLSPTAAGVSLETLLACRFLMGVGEAVTMPSIQAIVSQWVPQGQRSGWLSLIISGLQIGTVLAYWASPFIVDTWDWQTMFLAYGGLGLVWVSLWLPLVSDRDPSSALVTPAAARVEVGAGAEAVGTGRGLLGKAAAAEAMKGGSVVKLNGEDGISNGIGGGNGISSGARLPVQTVLVGERSSEGGDGGGRDKQEVGASKRGVFEGFRAVPWKEYATNGQIWSISVAHMSHNWGLYVLLAWLPTYFVQEFNLSLGQSSGASVQPWIAGAIAGNMAGLGADFLVNNGVLDVRSVRRLFQTVALVGPAACMLLLAQGPETSSDASQLFTAAVALGSCSCAGFGSSVQDLRSRDTGVIYGMTSACAAVFGSVGTYLAGVILDTTDSWTAVFQSTAAVYFVGACVYGLFYRAEPLAVKDRSALL